MLGVVNKLSPNAHTCPFCKTKLPRHRPVMLAEVLAALQPENGGLFVDGTFGAGGYTSAILQSAKRKSLPLTVTHRPLPQGRRW